MNKAELSMRTAHGEIGTFFEGFSDYFELMDIHNKQPYSLNSAIHNTHRLVQIIC